MKYFLRYSLLLWWCLSACAFADNSSLQDSLKANMSTLVYTQAELSVQLPAKYGWEILGDVEIKRDKNDRRLLFITDNDFFDYPIPTNFVINNNSLYHLDIYKDDLQASRFDSIRNLRTKIAKQSYRYHQVVDTLIEAGKTYVNLIFSGSPQSGELNFVIGRNQYAYNLNLYAANLTTIDEIKSFLAGFRFEGKDLRLQDILSSIKLIPTDTSTVSRVVLPELDSLRQVFRMILPDYGVTLSLPGQFNSYSGRVLDIVDSCTTLCTVPQYTLRLPTAFSSKRLVKYAFDRDMNKVWFEVNPATPPPCLKEEIAYSRDSRNGFNNYAPDTEVRITMINGLEWGLIYSYLNDEKRYSISARAYFNGYEFIISVSSRQSFVDAEQRLSFINTFERQE